MQTKKQTNHGCNYLETKYNSQDRQDIEVYLGSKLKSRACLNQNINRFWETLGMRELDVHLFEQVVPIEVKAIILEKLQESWSLEVRDKLRGLDFSERIRKVTLENLREHKDLPEFERQLWVDAFAIERLEDYSSSYIVIQLAVHWGLVDKIYLNTLHFSGCSALWRGPRFNGYIVTKICGEELDKYFWLVGHAQFVLDPFTKQDWEEHIRMMQQDSELEVNL